MLVSWVAKTCAIAAYSSRKKDGHPVGVGGMTGAPPKWTAATRPLRSIVFHSGW